LLFLTPPPINDLGDTCCFYPLFLNFLNKILTMVYIVHLHKYRLG
jgi:hypothetical protein